MIELLRRPLAYKKGQKMKTLFIVGLFAYCFVAVYANLRSGNYKGKHRKNGKQ